MKDQSDDDSRKGERSYRDAQCLPQPEPFCPVIPRVGRAPILTAIYSIFLLLRSGESVGRSSVVLSLWNCAGIFNQRHWRRRTHVPAM